MTRTFSTSHLEEVAQELKAGLLALLRVELHAVDVAGSDGRREAVAVRGGRVHVRRIGADEVEAVHEVEVAAGRDPLEEHRAFARVDLVPSHMGYSPVALRGHQP